MPEGSRPEPSSCCARDSLPAACSRARPRRAYRHTSSFQPPWRRARVPPPPGTVSSEQCLPMPNSSRARMPGSYSGRPSAAGIVPPALPASSRCAGINPAADA
jgi:hypothetical protein